MAIVCVQNTYFFGFCTYCKDRKEGVFMQKKELTEAEKKDLAMKLEIAEELGLLEKVEQLGWKGLTSRESGRIGGIMGKRKKKEREKRT